MSGLSVPLLPILSAIAVACAFALWRSRSTKTPGKASSEQAQQSEGSARTHAASADARRTSGIVNAITGLGQPRPKAQAVVSAPLTHPPAAAASVPASITTVGESQGNHPSLDTVPSESIGLVDDVAPVSAPGPKFPAASESINGDVNGVAHAPAEDAGVGDRDSERGEQAPQTPAVAPLADEVAATEEVLVAVRQATPNVYVTEVGAAEHFSARHGELIPKTSAPVVLPIDLAEQRLAPPAQARGAAPPPGQAAEALLATEEESPALQSLPDATNESRSSVNLTERQRNAVGPGDELAPSPTGYDGQQVGQSDWTADGLGARQPEEVLLPVGAAAVYRSGPVANAPEPEVTTAETHVLEPVETAQHASKTVPPFDVSVAVAYFGSKAAVTIRSEAAEQIKGELATDAHAMLSDARGDEPDSVAVIGGEAIGQASAPKAEGTVTSKQRAVVRAVQVAKPAEEHLPAREIGRTVADHERESATGRVGDLKHAEREDAAQFQHPALTADSTTGESPSADLELDDLHALLRPPLSRPARQAVHHDRRGRQTLQPQPSAKPKKAKRQSSLRPSAEVRIRLTLHPIRRTVGLALILLRAADFPEQVTLELNGSQTVDALDEGQYGDVDLTWDADLLLNEIRVSCAEGYQWVRGARPVHIFAADPTQADLVSVPAAKAGTDHTIICQEQDADTVCDIAESAGSVRPAALRRFSGMPNGWVVLGGYRPTRAAVIQPAAAFSPLDPGQGIEITLDDGLAVGHSMYAQGRPPCIRIEPMLDGISVRIGGVPAEVSSDGHWEAPGWDTPGQHRIEVVPGPSRSYEIKPDPGAQGGWTFWDAYDRLRPIDEGPWSRAQICGALLAGPSGERVLAAELQPTILTLGIDGTVGTLRPRAEAGVSVGFAAGMSAFLVTSSGRRRRQGKIVWLGVPQSSEVVTRPRRLSQLWVEAVRSAAARRLALQADEEGVGQLIWQKVVLLARSAKRQRRG